MDPVLAELLQVVLEIDRPFILADGESLIGLFET
jgi:hypothetical protein